MFRLPFRMPLHREGKGMAAQADRFDQAIRRARLNAQLRACLADALMMQ